MSDSNSNENGKRERSDEEEPEESLPPTKSLKNGDGEASQSTLGTEDTGNTDAKEKDAADSPGKTEEDPADPKDPSEKEDEAAPTDSKPKSEEATFVLDHKGTTEAQPESNTADPPAAESVPAPAPAPVPGPQPSLAPPVGVDPTVQATVVMTDQVVDERGEIPAVYVGKVIGKVSRVWWNDIVVVPCYSLFFRIFTTGRGDDS